MRNRLVFGKEKQDINMLVSKAVNLKNAFIHSLLKESEGGRRTQGLCKWSPPCADVFKLNCDATIIPGKGTGVGGVIRDNVGDPLMSFAELITEEYGIECAEALAAKKGMTLAWEAGFRAMTLEVDCLSLINAINRKRELRSDFGLLVNDIVALSRMFHVFILVHVKREANKVAHKLANLSSDFSGLKVWMEEVPYDCIQLIHVDLLS